MDDWKEYELQVVKYHQKNWNQITWHQEVIPEEVYIKSGYINNCNKHRLERIMKSRKDKSLSLNKNVPLLPDYGLDFISYDEQSDTFHGGQVKMYTNSLLTAKDCGSFINCVHCRLKTTGYLYTSKNKLEANFKEDISMSNGMIEHIVLPFEKTKEANVINDIDESLLELRPYQKESVQSVLDAETNKVLLKLCTGTGKTVIAGNIFKQKNPKNIICIAPLLFSVSELQRRITSFIPNHHCILMDCEGITDVQTIQEEMKAHDKWVVFATFKSFEEIVPQLNMDYTNTYLLIDEVHNCVNKITLNTISNKFDNSLYLSATVPEELQEFLDYEEVYSYNIRDAINEGHCVDYEVFLPYIEDESIPDELNHLDNLLCNKALFIATGMLIQGKRRCIAYLSTIEEAKNFEKIVKEVFKTYHGIDIETFTVHCDISKKERQRMVDAFCEIDFSRIKIICNVRIFNESINLVPCDCVYKTTPGNNDLTTAQQLGRAIRLDPNNPSKKAALFIWCSEWEDCVDSLQLLKQEDPEFHIKLRIQNKDYDKILTRQQQVQEETDSFIKFVEIKCLTLTEIWFKRLEHWISQYHRKGNKKPVEHAKDPEEKRAGIWQSHMRQNYKNTIENKKGTKLTPERINALNATEGWKWDDDPFQDNLDYWITQYRRKGNKTPRQQAEDPEEKRAGIWQCNMRQNYKNTIENKKGTKLTPERINALNATEGWKWDSDSFQDNLDHWIAQYRQKGNKKPTNSAKNPQEKLAGKWQSQMRQNYKNSIENKKGPKVVKLTPERINALNATKGWEWDSDSFQDNLDHWITQYRKKGNKKPAEHAKDPEEKRAGTWQSSMRTYYKNTIENKKGPKVVKLTPERINALNATEGWKWDSDSFQDNLGHWITQYRKKGNKKPRQQAEDPEEKRAGSWQSSMREAYKKKKKAAIMTPERITALNATEGWQWEGR